MVRRLRRIGPVKFGVVLGAVYAVISIIFIPFFLIFAVAGMFMPGHDSAGQAQQAMGIGMAVLFSVLAPIFYGIFGFLFGALGALIYNLVARLVGGIEFEVE